VERTSLVLLTYYCRICQKVLREIKITSVRLFGAAIRQGPRLEHHHYTSLLQNLIRRTEVLALTGCRNWIFEICNVITRKMYFSNCARNSHRSGHIKTEHAESLLLLGRHLGNWSRGPAVSMRSELVVAHEKRG
jgi:hypothetical protein